MSHHPNEVLQRARVARSVLTLVFVALASAFFRAQVLRTEEFALQSESNRLREVPLPGARAIIYDRNKEIIAENIAGYSVSILTPKEDSLRSAMRALARVVNLDSAQQERVIRRFRQSPYRPAVIFNDAAFDIVSVLEEHRVEFPGLIIQSAPKRYYPDGPAVAAFVGYTGEISQQDLQKDKFSDYKAGQQIGKAGLELQYESRLRGTEGMRYVEVDARNRVVRESGVRPDVAPEAPAPLYTNIDMDLQRFAHDYFGDSLQGAMVALEPATGKVLALYSAPSYDINKFIGGVSAEYYSSLQEDKRHPLYNKATQGRYPPASTWKLATAVIGLQKGYVTMDTHMEQPCRGVFYYGGRPFKCWNHTGGHGDISLAQAIAQSCDVYFYQLGLKIGLLDLVAGGVKLGFQSQSGIDLPEESRSLFPDGTKYFDKKYGPRGWTKGFVVSMSIGQGDNAQTPLNMAKFYTALATDGKAATPRIVDTTVVRTEALGLDPEKLKGLQNALGDVLTRGTGAGARIEGLTIAGKTGTAQNPPNPDHAWFVGYAPVEHPKIVVAVLLEYGLHGSAAAKIATKMMERYLKAKLTLTSITPDG
ncbi:MAG: penicillin-binding protein 2 [Gemmatimonas sp.]